MFFVLEIVRIKQNKFGKKAWSIKSFDQKRFWLNKKVGKKTFCSKTKSLFRKKSWWKKRFWSKKKLGKKKTILAQGKFCWKKKCFGQIKFCGKKL